MHYFGRTALDTELAGFRILEKQHEEREEVPVHRHERPYLTFVANGAYEESSGGSTTRLGSGTAVFHTSGECHSDQFLTRSRLLVVELPQRFLELGAFDEPWRQDGPEIRRISETLRREVRDPDEVTSMILDGLLYELSGLAVRSRRSFSGNAGSAAVRLIDERFQEPISLSVIAEEIGLDPSRLSREFRETTGSSVGERIRRKRVEFVCEQLRSNQSLSVVAHEAGFSDQSHMTRTFRRVMGMTPGAWRRLLRT